MDEKQEKVKRLKYIGWIILCIFAMIFGVWVEDYNVFVPFTLIIIFKYFENKYPELFE